MRDELLGRSAMLLVVVLALGACSRADAELATSKSDLGEHTAIEDFEDASALEAWTVEARGGASASISRAPGHAGAGARLTMSFTRADGWVAMHRALPNAMTARQLAMWARSAPGVKLAVRLTDAGGHAFEYDLPRPLGALDPAAFYRQIVPIAAPTRHDGDGLVPGAITAVDIVATAVAASVSTAAESSLDVDDIEAVTLGALDIDGLAATSVVTGELFDGVGVDVHPLDYLRLDHWPEPYGDRLDAARAAGFSWVRTDLTWRDVESSGGKYDFATYDALLELLSARQMHALFVLDYGNARHTGDDGLPPTSDAAITAFGNFAAAAADHFRGRVSRYEVWNEPNLPQFWKPGPSAAAYAKLARTVTARVHAIDPTIEVTTAGLSRFDFDFLRGYLAEGGADGVNALAIHPYRDDGPETAMDELLAMRDLASHLPSAPAVWSTEWGYPSTQFGAGTSIAARTRQAIFVARQVLAERLMGLPFAVTYDLVDDAPVVCQDQRCGFGASDPGNPEQNFGMLGVAGGALVDKPAVVALRALAKAGGEHAKIIGFDAPGPTGFYALTLEGDRGRAVVVWSSRPGVARDVLVPEGMTMRDLFGNAIAPSGSPVVHVTEAMGPVIASRL